MTMTPRFARWTLIALGVLAVVLFVTLLCWIRSGIREISVQAFVTDDIVVNKTATVTGPLTETCTAAAGTNSGCNTTQINVATNASVVDVASSFKCTGTMNTTAGRSACIGAIVQATATRSGGAVPVENTALEVDATGGQNNEALLIDNGDIWQQEFVAGTQQTILLRTGVAGLSIGGGTLPFGGGGPLLPAVGEVNLTGATVAVRLGSLVDPFKIPGSASVAPQIEIGTAAGSSIGMGVSVNQTVASQTFAGFVVGLYTTLNGNARGGYLLWRGAGGGFAGTNEGGLVMSAASGFPFFESTANSVGLFNESTQPIFFGADGTTFTSSFGIFNSNHIVESQSTGVPTMDAGCTSGGSAALVGNDTRFTVKTGTTSVACTITFKKTFTSVPMCLQMPYGTATLAVCTPSATQMVCSLNASATSYTFDCQGQPGGT